MPMPDTTRNSIINWFQDYRACARDATNELITTQLIKELSPDPRKEFLTAVLEEVVGMIPFGEEAIKVRKFVVLAVNAKKPPEDNDVAKHQTYARTVINDYQNKLRKEVISKANKDWDKASGKGSLDEYLFKKGWFVQVFKEAYCDIDDDNRDLDLKDNALTKSIKVQWRSRYARFKQEVKRREKEEEKKRRERERRGQNRRRRDGGRGVGADG